MASYYKILGVPEGASEAEIKKTYRRLAMEYHPDKNDSPQAGARFIQITEAYQELLKGNTEPTEVDGVITPSRWADDFKMRQDPAWRKAFAERLKKARKLAEDEGIQYFHSYLKSYKFKLSLVSMVLCVLFALTMAVDKFAPGEVTNEPIKQKYMEMYVNPNDTGIEMHDYYIQFPDDELFRVPYEQFQRLAAQNEIAVERSIIFNEALHMNWVQDGVEAEVIEFDHYLYDSIFVWLIVFLLPLLRIVLKKADVSYYFFDFAVRSAFPIALGVILYNLLA